MGTAWRRTCSKGCSKLYKRTVTQRYLQSPEGVAYRHAYTRRPDVREKDRVGKRERRAVDSLVGAAALVDVLRQGLAQEAMCLR